MKLKPMLLVVLLLINLPELVVGSEARYPIKDSKFPTAEAKLGWIDNGRVIFHGYEVGKFGKPSPEDGHPLAETGLFIWDTERDTVTKYWEIDGPVPLCVFQGRIFFSTKLKEKENKWLVVSGTLGKEEQKTVSGNVFVNGHSCRVSDQKPGWAKEDKHRRLRLLEEHGYLDFGIPSRADLSKASWIMLYKSNKKEGIQLPFTGEQIRLHTTYFEFAGIYLLEGQIETTYAAPIWKLESDGAVKQILKPTGKAWERIGWGGYSFTRKGLFLSGGRGEYAGVGTRGGYLLKLGGESPSRLIEGFVKNEAVSPDGCKLAFVHVLHSQAGADSFKALREGQAGTRTLKMINLCEGE